MRIKKYLFISLASLAVISCSEKPAEPSKPEEKEEPEETAFVPFAMYADIATVTSESMAKTSWADGDKLYVSSDDWSATFTCASGKFTTDKKIEKGSHTFNVATVNASEFTVAPQQTSTGTVADILAGQVVSDTPVEDVTVNMSHLVSFASVTVQNRAKKDINLASIEIEAAEANIAGVYTIKFGETTTAELKSDGASKITVDLAGKVLANAEEMTIAAILAPSDFSGNIKVTVKEQEGAATSANVAVESIAAGETYAATITVKPAPGPNLVKNGDFSTEDNWTLKNINGDDATVFGIKDGHLEISRSTASTKDYRFVFYNELDAPLEAGSWYKMSVRISVPTPCTWYSRGIDLGFCVFGKDPTTLNDYKANKDVIFFVDTDMEAARQEVGPLHGTEGYVSFPVVCTYCNPADLKTNGGIFQAVEGQKWVGFYLRERNSLKELNPVLFDDVMIQKVEAPEE